MTNFVYQDQYFKVLYDPERDLMVDIWTDKTEELHHEDFQNLLLKWKSFVEKYQARYALTDIRNSKFTVSVEIQGWIIQNITIPLSQHSRYAKHVFVEPEEFFSNLSHEQLVDENVVVPTRFYSSLSEARHWLLDEEEYQSFG